MHRKINTYYRPQSSRDKDRDVFNHMSPDYYQRNVYTHPHFNSFRNIYCANCGEKGHVVKSCDRPITSFGIIAFKIAHNKEDEVQDRNNVLNELVKAEMRKANDADEHSFPKIKFLMIQRKDTMGYIDFVRGKYPTSNDTEKNCKISTLLSEMTYKEKHNLLTKSFDEIWNALWVNHESKCFKNEYEGAKRKFCNLDVPTLVKNSKTQYDFQEFGFPKGRRNMKESNIVCAEREFYEETGYDSNCYDFISNYPLVHEEFIGTNGVKYRHIYYLVKMKDKVRPPKLDTDNKVQAGEVRNIGWFSFKESMILLRPYDTAKKEVLKYVYNDINEMKLNFVCSSVYSNREETKWKLENPYCVKSNDGLLEMLYEDLRQKYIDSKEILIDSSTKRC